MNNRFYIWICAALLLFMLCGCTNSSYKSGADSTSGTVSEKLEGSISEDTCSESTMPTSSETGTKLSIDYSIPKEFVDYRKFIGADISVLNVDTSKWDYDEFSHDLWDGSFYGQMGVVSIRLGWDNKTIVEFFLVLNDKIQDDEREILNKKINSIFGNNVNETMVGYDFSGKGDYEFTIPKTLEQESVCCVSWNSDIMYNYMCSKPKEPQEDETTKQPSKKEEPRIGMTAEDVRKSTWGEPKNINKTTYIWGTKEQWCYSGYRYIYFENGIVTAIQERE